MIIKKTYNFFVKFHGKKKNGSNNMTMKSCLG